MGFRVNAASCAAAAAGAAPPEDPELLFATFGVAAGLLVLPVALFDAVLVVDAAFVACAGFVERTRVSSTCLRAEDSPIPELTRCAWLHGLRPARCGPYKHGPADRCWCAAESPARDLMHSLERIII